MVAACLAHLGPGVMSLSQFPAGTPGQAGGWSRCDFLTDCILFKSTIRHLWDRCGFGTVLYLYAELPGAVCDMALFFGWGNSKDPS